jgi:phosphoribosylamine-glycine ligase
MNALYTDSFLCTGSTNLEAVYHDRDTGNLYVEFLNGTIAGYRNVPQTTYRGLASATSRGGYYNANVKGKFTGIDTSNVDDFEKRSYTSTVSISGQTTYVVRGSAEVEITIVANSVDEAVAKAKEKSKTLKVTEVAVKFV